MRIVFKSCLLMLAAVAAVPAQAFEAAEPFVASGDPASFERALQCLTEAVYYEARSESDDGQRAVAQVVLNRVRHPSYPSTVCGVVYQGSQRSTGCQFSFTCDGSMGGWIEPGAWSRAQRIAQAALRGSVYRPVGHALNYHTTAIRPYWAPSLVRQTVVGAHIFYRRPGYGGTSDAFVQTPSGDEPEAAPQVRYASARLEQRPTVRRGRMSSMEMAVVERAVAEIAVLERPVLYRTSGARSPAASRSARSGRSAASAPAPATVRRAPRVTVQGGVRIMRGS
jgi:hypothetical protein